jgi:hypothetical protein
VNNEWEWLWTEVVMAQLWYYPAFASRHIIKPRKSVNSVHPGRDSNHALPYHKSEALTLLPACSIRTI